MQTTSKSRIVTFIIWIFDPGACSLLLYYLLLIFLKNICQVHVDFCSTILSLTIFMPFFPITKNLAFHNFPRNQMMRVYFHFKLNITQQMT
ncbi:hypothetical protein Hanom_Chr14g01332881 [Helianthus anomalus]